MNDYRSSSGGALTVLFILSAATCDSGASKVWLEVIPKLRGRGIEPLVMIPREGELAKSFRVNNVEVIVEPYFWWARSIKPRTLKEAMHVLLAPLEDAVTSFSEKRMSQFADRVDLVYIFDGVIGMGSRFARLFGIPYVFHCQELLEEGLGYTFRDRAKAVEALKDADEIIGVSRSVSDKWASLANREVVTIQNGLNFNSLAMGVDRRIEVGLSARIIMLANIVPHKGQLVAAKAFSSFLKHNPRYRNVKLRFCGRVQDRNYFSALRLEVEQSPYPDAIEIMPFTEDPMSELTTSDIALVCSVNEAFGLVTLEAMAAGCLVIGSDSGGTAELLDEGRGILFSPNDEKSLEKALEKVFDNYDMANAVARKGNSYAALLTVDRQTEEIAQVITRCAK